MYLSNKSALETWRSTWVRVDQAGGIKEQQISYSGAEEHKHHADLLVPVPGCAEQILSQQTKADESGTELQQPGSGEVDEHINPGESVVAIHGLADVEEHIQPVHLVSLQGHGPGSAKDTGEEQQVHSGDQVVSKIPDEAILPDLQGQPGDGDIVEIIEHEARSIQCRAEVLVDRDYVSAGLRQGQPSGGHDQQRAGGHQDEPEEPKSLDMDKPTGRQGVVEDCPGAAGGTPEAHHPEAEPPQSKTRFSSHDVRERRGRRRARGRVSGNIQDTRMVGREFGMAGQDPIRPYLGRK